MTEKSDIVVKVVDEYKLYTGTPVRQPCDSNAGWDLVAREIEDRGNTIKVKLGIRTEILNPGYHFEMYPRSSISKLGLMLHNSVGVIDQSYRGEWMAIFLKTDDYKEGNIKVGDRVAQAILKKTLKFTFLETDKLSETSRGDGGFGSTGK